MKLGNVVRAGIERRIADIERMLGAAEGVVVERIGDGVRVRGRKLLRRSIDELSLRFAGLGR